MQHTPIFIVLFFALCMAMPSTQAGEKTLTIAADAWCPINCRPEDPQQGIGIDLAKRIFEPRGYKIRYVIMPWARALEEVRTGKVDAIVGANRHDDPTLIFPTAALCNIVDSFFVRQPSTLVYKNIESLKGLRLGVIKDYGYSEPLQKFLEQATKTPGLVQPTGGDDALEQNIRKLLAGRIDVVVESSVVMEYMLKRLGLENKIERRGGIPQGRVYLAFSPALEHSRTLAATFDSGMATLKTERALQALYAPYGLEAP